jgi:hypothetical protein
MSPIIAACNLYTVTRKMFALVFLVHLHNISSIVLLSRTVYRETLSTIKSTVRANQTSFTNYIVKMKLMVFLFLSAYFAAALAAGWQRSKFF